ncbi:MAG: tRNA lysidine(34) synthetase TilS [Mariprofundaceae bacterium]
MTVIKGNVPFILEAEQWLQASNIPEKVAVAWSGGADSTALLLALYSYGKHPVAWHIDHAWHDDSSHHASSLKLLAQEWGIPFFCCRLRDKLDKNREAEARKARYKIFSRWGKEQNVSTLCLGHHLDDQAETVFLRLLQGSSASGCQGMKEVRSLGELNLVRPLLSIPKHGLETALRRAGVHWLNDPSNRDLSLRRNHIRQIVFPRMRQAGTEPRELFSRFSIQAISLVRYMRKKTESFDLRQQDGLVSMDWYEWQAQTPCIRAFLLQQMTVSLFGAGRVLGRRHILLTEHWVEKGGYGGLDLSGSRLYRESSRLYLKENTVRKEDFPDEPLLQGKSDS